MKKSLSLLVAIALVFGMFASAAFAADNTQATQDQGQQAPAAQAAPTLTSDQKYQELLDAKVLKGNPDGNPRLADKLTRAEFVTIAVEIGGLQPVEGNSFSDTKGHWASGAIEAAVKAGLVNGMGDGKFAPKANVRIEEVIKVAALLAGLKPVDGAKVAGSDDWAGPYIQAAIDAGLISATQFSDYTADATRAQAIDVAYPAWKALQGPTVKEAKVVDANNVEVTFSDGSVEKVKLDTALEPNKETEITVTHNGKEYKVKVTYVVTDATKVDSVSATNLKQIVVKFDGEVDSVSATDESNYSISGGPAALTITGAALSDDKTTVTLTVSDSGAPNYVALTNQTEYKLTVSNIKAGDKIINATDVKFTPVDSTIPTVTSATALGNRTIKVVFSEPVTPATSSASFKIDGNSLVGSVQADGSNTVFVKTYSVLSNGAHKINISGVPDYFGLKSLSQDFDVNVVEDTTPPTIDSVVKASFEQVTLKFSEPIDQDTLVAGNVYYIQAGTKKYASSIDKVSDDTYTFNFTLNPLPYAIDVYVTGAQDYSGNTIATDSKIFVTPVLDTTRPEVTNVTFDAATSKFTIKFSKVVDVASAQTPGNYVVKDSTGAEVSNYKTAVVDSVDKKKVYVTLGLGTGTELTANQKYTLTISGVTDTTTLKNAILPYTYEFTVADVAAFKLADTNAVVVDKANNRFYVTFNKTVAVSGDGSAVDITKYFYHKTSDNSWNKFPDGTGFNVQADGKTVIITVAKGDLDLNTVVIDKLRVLSVKDAAGNSLTGGIAEESVVDPSTITVGIDGAKATATNKLELHATTPLLANTFNLADFKVTANGQTLNLLGGSIDGQTIYLTLSDGNKLNENAKYTVNGTDYDVFVGVNANARTSTSYGAPLQVGSVKATDAIPATIDSVTSAIDGSALYVNFNEALQTVTTPDTTTIATDFYVKDVINKVEFKPGIGPNEFKVTTSGKTATIHFNAPQSGIFSVKVVNPRFLKDAATPGNVVAASGEFQVRIGSTAPSALISTVAGENAADKLVITVDQPLYKGGSAITNPTDLAPSFDKATTAKLDSANYDPSTGKITFDLSTTPATVGKKIVINSAVGLTNFSGDAFTATFTFDGTKWVKS